MRYLDWIWRIRGSLPLEHGTRGEALHRLSRLFREKGTSHAREGDVLTFRKASASSQDRMAVFDGGRLALVDGPSGSELAYDLTSHALLWCFLAPFVFLAVSRFVPGSRKSGLVFASLFAILYVAGQVIERRNVRALFRRTLDGGEEVEDELATGAA